MGTSPRFDDSLDTQANKTKDTALNGGYGAKFQKMVQTLQGKVAPAPAA